MSTLLKSLTRDMKPPMLMEGRPDGSLCIHWPEELKTVHMRMLDNKGMTINIGQWMSGTRGGMKDWEKDYYHVSALIMLANNQSGGVTTEISNRWDAAFFLGIMWDRFRRNRGAKVEMEEIISSAEQMDAIVKRFHNAR